MSQEMAVYGAKERRPIEVVNFEDYAMTADVLKKRIELINHVMKEIMRDGEHYGKIPGCGDKPTLLKPGAEKLSTAFRLAPSYEIRRTDLQNGHREYELVCTLTHMISGQVVGQGVGLCSTMESKYRYRLDEPEDTGKIVSKEYWDTRKADPNKAQELIGGKGFVTKKIDGQWKICRKSDKRVENSDIADTYNTVLKMAKKRAHVDAVLTATAASDIFTQDVEDMAGNGEVSAKHPEEKKTAGRTKKEAREDKPPAATREQIEVLHVKGATTWRDATVAQVKEYTKAVAVWFRKGAYLTKDEATELIANWEAHLDTYEAEKQLAQDDGRPGPVEK